MAELFRQKDPRGIEVYSSEEQWNQHVLFQHEDMEENLNAVIQTVMAPDSIYESHDSEPPMDYREIYSKEVKTATYYPEHKFTRVVVSTLGAGAELITAYPGDSETQGTIGEAIYRAPEH